MIINKILVLILILVFSGIVSAEESICSDFKEIIVIKTEYSNAHLQEYCFLLENIDILKANIIKIHGVEKWRELKFYNSETNSPSRKGFGWFPLYVSLNTLRDLTLFLNKSNKTLDPSIENIEIDDSYEIIKTTKGWKIEISSLEFPDTQSIKKKTAFISQLATQVERGDFPDQVMADFHRVIMKPLEEDMMKKVFKE